MKFSLLVLGDPASTTACQLALRFARASVDSGHEVFRVFFYSDAVRLADANLETEDSAELKNDWTAWAGAHGVELVACVSSAYRRGVLDEHEAKSLDREASLAPGFEIAGLGQLAEACMVSDRLMTFGR